jgi:hypothetical protein
MSDEAILASSLLSVGDPLGNARDFSSEWQKRKQSCVLSSRLFLFVRRSVDLLHHHRDIFWRSNNVNTTSQRLWGVRQANNTKGPPRLSFSSECLPYLPSPSRFSVSQPCSLAFVPSCNTRRLPTSHPLRTSSPRHQVRRCGNGNLLLLAGLSRKYGIFHRYSETPGDLASSR